MRPWVLGFWCALVLGGSLQGMAQQQQQQSGPRTLEGLLNSGEAQAPTATAEAAKAAVPAGRIQGAVARPKDGVQHPDLDAAWTEYDKQIETAAKAIEQAIERELSKAAEAGDLDAALKWKTAGEQFKKAGRIPEGLDGQKPRTPPKQRPAKSESSSESLVAEAQVRLAKAYEAVEKELVKSLDLEKATQVRSEKTSLTLAIGSPEAMASLPPKEAVAFGKHRYMLFRDAISWPEAKKRCDEMGGHLVTITSPEENDFVFRVSGGRRCWIGMSYDPKQRRYVWVTNEPARYARWRPSQPNGGDQIYVGISWGQTAEWEDYSPHPNDFQEFICEWDHE